MKLLECEHDGSCSINPYRGCRIVQKQDPQTTDDKYPKRLLNGDKPDFHLYLRVSVNIYEQLYCVLQEYCHSCTVCWTIHQGL